MAEDQERLKEIHINVMNAIINSMKSAKEGKYDEAVKFQEESQFQSKLLEPLLTTKGAHHFRDEANKIILTEHPTCTMENIKTYTNDRNIDLAIECYIIHKEAGIKATDNLSALDFEAPIDIIYHDDKASLRTDSLVLNVDEL